MRLEAAIVFADGFGGEDFGEGGRRGVGAGRGVGWGFALAFAFGFGRGAGVFRGTFAVPEGLTDCYRVEDAGAAARGVIGVDA